MKKITLFVTLALSALLCRADDCYLRLTLTDGRLETFALSARPAVTFSGDKMNVSAPEMVFSVDRADVTKMDFTTDAATIAEWPENEPVYSFRDDVFSAPGQNLTVFSTAGIRVAEGRDSVSLSHLNSGIYLVNLNNKTIKLFKK